jgi:hypothetical protein
MSSAYERGSAKRTEGMGMPFAGNGSENGLSEKFNPRGERAGWVVVDVIFNIAIAAALK